MKTRGVAEALGVSASTVKRWVDSGLIRAVRTVGKHRLIPVAEAMRVAREQGVRRANVEVVAGFGAARPEVIDDRVRDVLYGLLRESRGRAAKALIESVYLAGCGASVLADELIRPVMERVGHGWMVGSWDVFQEHEATQIVTATLRGLIDRTATESDAPKPLALGAAPKGDPYVLSTLLGELLLVEQGWEVRNLGVNLPLLSLASAVETYEPALVFLSVNYVPDIEAFVRDYSAFYRIVGPRNCGVMLGGQALSAELRARLMCTGFGDRMAHLGEFARRIGGGPPPASDTKA
jgi:excisionase family DNA binding protein